MGDAMTELPVATASLDKAIEVEDPFANSDPFAKSWDELKENSRLDANFKRRTTRTEKAIMAGIQIPKDSQGQISPAYISAARAQPQGQGADSKKINPGQVYRNGYGVFDVITPPYNLYELSSYYDTSFTNHASIDAKVSNVVGLGYHFDMTPKTLMAMQDADNKKSKKLAKKKVERLKTQLRGWLDSTNDEDTFDETLAKVLVDLEATGNGYIEIGRTVRGDIGYIGHIPSITVRVRRLRDGFVQIIAGTIVYFRNFQAKNPNPITDDPRPNEIIHIKSYSPLNSFYGVPDIVAAMASLVGDQMAEQYNVDYFANKAVPRYVVTVKGAKLSRESEDKLFSFLQTGLKGQNHRTLYIPLPGDSEGNKVEFNMDAVETGVQEASFDKYRKNNRDNILMAHQVPLSKLGGVDASAVAAAMSQDRTFREQVARPAQGRLEKRINKIIAEKTDVIQLKLNELTITDEIAQSQIYERYVKNKIMTPNEVREGLGMTQIEGGDTMVDLTPKQQSDTRANMAGNKERDTERSNAQSDGPGAASGRNPKGEGAKTT